MKSGIPEFHRLNSVLFVRKICMYCMIGVKQRHVVVLLIFLYKSLECTFSTELYII